MGGRSTGSGMSTSDNSRGGSMSIEDRLVDSGEYVGQVEVERQIEDVLNFHLGEGEQNARVDSFNIISNPGDGLMGDVEAQYHVDVRIPIGRDPETGDMEYEYDTEYRSDVFQVVLRRQR